MIELVNLQRQIVSLRPQLLDAFESVLNDRAFIQGPYVAQFEKAFAFEHGSQYAVGCASGTAALSLVLDALGVGDNDEVILPAHTFAATAAAVCQVGAVPVFADIEPGSYSLDPTEVERKLTSRTKAVLPVHLYGVPCRVDAIRDVIGSRPDVILVEDGAQAHLARYNDLPVGTLSEAVTFSFHPGKNLGAYGDAGAILTNDLSIVEHLRKLRDHGRNAKYTHEILGYNQRMDGIQAAMLSVKLPYLSTWNIRRREVAARYDETFVPLNFKVIEPPVGSLPVYHLYVVEVSNRTVVQDYLKNRQIATGIHYPIPLHRQAAFMNYSSDKLPVTERTAGRIVSLPICSELTDSEQSRVIETFLEIAEP
jgi:dTDP-4-amino-4,6-dideoxygalactose transaminase